MYNFVFLDTETTGTGPGDRLCQLAFKTSDETYNALFNPGRKIPAEASAVTHITNKMVADKPAFKESPDYLRIKELLEDPSTIMICHNAQFDNGMLEREGIKPNAYICSLKVVRYLDKEMKFSQYKLQYLRYFLELEVEAAAHDALGDVLVLEKFFEYVYEEMLKECGGDEEATIQKMLEVSTNPSLLSIFSFGKYAGKKISDVASQDPGYLEWLLNQKLQNPDGEEDWIYTLRFNLKKL
jgi:DNA polymerase III epsilon subunit-like protein